MLSRTGWAQAIVQIGKVDGQQPAKLAGSDARMVLDADYLAGGQLNSTSLHMGRSQNTLGTLPGAGEGVIVVVEPVTGWFGTAAERGGPFGILMTLARHYSQAYADTPRHPGQTPPP